MLKLLLTLCSLAILAILVLQLRQQRQELGFQTSALHDQIKGRQGKLWNQQLQIAIYTAPNAISQTVNNHELNMVPQAPPPPGRSHWIDVKHDADAE